MENKDARTLLDAIQEMPRYKPNKWVSDFLVSIEDKIDDGDNLTEAQSDKLEQIYRQSQGGQ